MFIRLSLLSAVRVPSERAAVFRDRRLAPDSGPGDKDPGPSGTAAALLDPRDVRSGNRIPVARASLLGRRAGPWLESAPSADRLDRRTSSLRDALVADRALEMALASLSTRDRSGREDGRLAVGVAWVSSFSSPTSARNVAIAIWSSVSGASSFVSAFGEDSPRWRCRSARRRRRASRRSCRSRRRRWRASAAFASSPSDDSTPFSTSALDVATRVVPSRRRRAPTSSATTGPSSEPRRCCTASEAPLVDAASLPRADARLEAGTRGWVRACRVAAPQPARAIDRVPATEPFVMKVSRECQRRTKQRSPGASATSWTEPTTMSLSSSTPATGITMLFFEWRSGPTVMITSWGPVGSVTGPAPLTGIGSGAKRPSMTASVLLRSVGAVRLDVRALGWIRTDGVAPPGEKGSPSRLWIDSDSSVLLCPPRNGRRCPIEGTGCGRLAGESSGGSPSSSRSTPDRRRGACGRVDAVASS